MAEPMFVLFLFDVWIRLLFVGHVYMWFEGDTRRGGISQGHSCSKPGAAVGIHVPG